MSHQLLNPKINVAKKRMLTHQQMIRLVRRLRSRKFGAKLLAYEVEEITTTEFVTLEALNGRERVVLSPGNYYDVYIEYCAEF